MLNSKALITASNHW